MVDNCRRNKKTRKEQQQPPPSIRNCIFSPVSENPSNEALKGGVCSAAIIWVLPCGQLAGKPREASNDIKSL